MKKKHRFHLKSSHMLAILTIICIGLLAATFASDFSVQPLRNAVGYVVIPFEKGINRIGGWVNDLTGSFGDVKKLSEENEKLQQQVDELTEENQNLLMGQKELERLEALYDVDEEYSKHDKVLAKVIAKDPGNWYSTFTIDKGKKDGIQTDMNVIAPGGLVGIVTETGKSWATVRTIIDDGSNVSGMTISDSDTCIVSGSLEMMDSGRIQFSQLQSTDGNVAVGENIVTSHISDKYLKGLFIGTIISVEQDANNLTCRGYLVPSVDFRHLEEVFVITKLKETSGSKKTAADEESTDEK